MQGANLKLRQILSSNCVLLESVLYFLTFQCSDNSFYEAKIYLHDSGYELVKFRSAKFWPRYCYSKTNEVEGQLSFLFQSCSSQVILYF